MRCPAPIRPIPRPRARAITTAALALGLLLAGCDWPAPPEVTIPPPVTWSADPTGAGVYREPVDGVITDPFREPEHPYGPGNRGIEYRTEPGTDVRAAQAGAVAFSGQVAGRLVVALDHPDGRRTTYTGLAVVSVTRGQAVTSGQRIGSAGSVLHFGVKAGGAYVDPALLFGPPVVVLVPDRPATD